MWCATIVAEGSHSRQCPNPPKCSQCGKSGHLAKDCWSKDPSKRPSGTLKANQRQLPSLLLLPKGKEKAAEAKSKDVAKVSVEKLKRVRNPKSLKSLRSQKWSKRKWNPRPEGHGGQENHRSDWIRCWWPKRATATSSTETVTHHLSSTLQEFVGSVGIGDPKTCWLVDSGATCHIVSEKWVKHYTVSFEYQGPRPSLKGGRQRSACERGCRFGIQGR